jgi:hypothetical protein
MYTKCHLAWDPVSWPIWIAGLVLAALISLSTPALAQTATSDLDEGFREDIKSLLYVLGSDQIAGQMVQILVEDWKEQYPDLPPEFWERLGAEFRAEELIDLIVPIYAKYLTHADVVTLLNFFQSPVGQHYVLAQGPIQQESIAVGEAWGRQVTTRFIEKLKLKPRQ